MQSTCSFGSAYITCWAKTVGNPTAEAYNLHRYLLKYDHLCYNLLILVKGFAWYRKIYNVMDHYFIIRAKGKKLQIFTVLNCISSFFPYLETQRCVLESVRTRNMGSPLSLGCFVSSGFPSVCNFLLYLRHSCVTTVLLVVQKQRKYVKRNCVGSKWSIFK